MNYVPIAVIAALCLCASPMVHAQSENEWLEKRFKHSNAKGKHKQQAFVDDDGIGCDIMAGAVGMIPYAGPFIAPFAARGCEAERMQMLEKHRRNPQPSTRVYTAGIPKERAIAIIRKEIQKAFDGELGERLLAHALESGKLDLMIKMKVAEAMSNAAKAKGVPLKTPSPQAEAPAKEPEAETKPGVVPPEYRRPPAEIQAKFVYAVLRQEDEPQLLKLVAPIEERRQEPPRSEIERRSSMPNDFPTYSIEGLVRQRR